MFFTNLLVTFYPFIRFSKFKKPDTAGCLGNTKLLKNWRSDLCTHFEGSPKNAYIFRKLSFLGEPCSFRILVLTAWHKWKSCSLLVPAGCEIAIKSLTLKPISEPSPKKGPFSSKSGTKKGRLKVLSNEN